MTISQNVNYKCTVSGGAHVNWGTLLAWLPLEATYSYWIVLGGEAWVASGYEGYWYYDDYHFHSSATYDEWYCTDEDLYGQVAKYYQGRYTATGYEFDHRTYWANIYAI